VPAQPLPALDGECRFCRLWVDRWRESWSGSVDFAPAASHAARFPEIPAGAYAEAVLLVETDGTVYSGAEAILRARAHGLGRAAWRCAFLPPLPGCRRWSTPAIAPWRKPPAPVSADALAGRTESRPARYSIAAGIFLRMLAVIYFIAFASLWWQLGA